MNKTYFEVVVEGHHELIKGFALGFLAARGIEGEAVFAREHHVKGGGKLHQLMRIVSATEEQTRVIIGEGIGRALREAYERRQSELAIKVVSIRRVVGARFNFSYKTFSKEFGEKLKATFADLPPGVQISGYKPEEVTHPKAKGVEVYAPLHDYELKASGKVFGPAKEVIDFYDRIEHNELIGLEEIELEFS
jgi:hypothetical protein